MSGQSHRTPAPSARMDSRPATVRTRSRPRPSWPRSPSRKPSTRPYRRRVSRSPARWSSRNTSAFTTAHATFDDPVPAQIVADGGWTTTTTVTGTTATPASATGFPAGDTLTIAPLGTVTFTINAHVSATYDGTQVTNVATATPALNTKCEDGQATCRAEVGFANPAQLDGGEVPLVHRTFPGRGTAGHLHGDRDQPR